MAQKRAQSQDDSEVAGPSKHFCPTIVEISSICESKCNATIRGVLLHLSLMKDNMKKKTEMV